MAERNMCSVATRDTVVPPGSKSTSRANGSRRNLGGLASGRQKLRERDGPHREGEEPKPMTYGHEKSDLVIVASRTGLAKSCFGCMSQPVTTNPYSSRVSPHVPLHNDTLEALPPASNSMLEGADHKKRFVANTSRRSMREAWPPVQNLHLTKCFTEGRIGQCVCRSVLCR
jgi:hypothetical protein